MRLHECVAVVVTQPCIAYFLIRVTSVERCNFPLSAMTHFSVSQTGDQGMISYQDSVYGWILNLFPEKKKKKKISGRRGRGVGWAVWVGGRVTR